ncbi:MAG: hypothetical protein ACFB4J_12370 [Elainellaceae cyanobacterium]
MGRIRSRQKCCSACFQSASVLFRVRIEDAVTGELTPWLFLCDRCVPTAQQSPGYVYGGTWKAKKAR